MTATKSTMSNSDVYEKVTAKLTAAMEKGVVPWARGWVGASGMPVNAMTRRPYNGVNVLVLWMESLDKGYTSDGWMTFNQARKNGMMVRKGEKATTVVWMKKMQVPDRDNPKEKTTIMLARMFWVFNLDQLDDAKGSAGKVQQVRQRLEGKRAEIEPITECEMVVAATGAKIRHGGDAAYYSPNEDRVQMPKRDDFTSPEAYYATMFHELGHWTGHPTRLARYDVKKSGAWTRTNGLDRPQEELIAELTAAFTCARLNIEHITQAASYLKHWLGELHDDAKFLVSAASAASKAANLLMGADEGDDTTDEEEA